MKIVFSRKGFDSQYGGVPSPVFPDGTALSLPIPARHAPTRFREVLWGDRSVGTVVESLTEGRVRAEDRCHLDPDLRASALAERQAGWRPAFGQVEIAQSHLEREGVGPGDLFLFFGWFRPVESAGPGKWRYVRRAPGVHRMFGWLQVSEAVSVGNRTASARTERPWLSAHPHVNGRSWPPNNTIYISTRALCIGGTKTGADGGGLFRHAGDRLTLTAPQAANRSCWRLPEWFWPPGGPPSLSYHRNEQRWRRQEPWAYVHTVGRGQEFVFDAGGIPEATTWLRELFRTAGSRPRRGRA